MKKFQGLMILLLGITLTGCSGAFGGGTGAGAGYEYQANRAMSQIDDDLLNGKITQQEYDIRKDQIKKGSLLK